MVRGYGRGGVVGLPFGAESAGLDAGEFDVPFWLYFLGDCFGEAFYCPLYEYRVISMSMCKSGV